MEIKALTTLLSVQLGVDYTEEQRQFIENFNRSMIAFSDPGTGKTMSAVGGLIVAELGYAIPGQNIYAMSFTKAATAELKNRHEKACKKLHIRQNVNFDTLHKICLTILQDNHTYLGMDSFRVSSDLSWDDYITLVEDTRSRHGLQIERWQIYPLVKAINLLNASLIFDRTHIESKKVFKDIKISYEDFCIYRKDIYTYNLLSERVCVHDILLYTLELLLKHPEIAEQFKRKCKLLLIDEFQDMSLLMLYLVAQLTDRLIVIGDMKQQIYAFNGACQQIVKYFYEYFPDALTVTLTKSFRCSNEIAAYATKLILPNKVGGENFKGNDTEGIVKLHCRLNIKSVCDKIGRDYLANCRRFDKDIMFLFRNNMSAIPIMEYLYKADVPFRTDKFLKATELPVIKLLTQLATLASCSYNLDTFVALKYIIPEFRGYKNYKDIPLYQIALKTGQNLFDIPYKFRDPGPANVGMEALLRAKCAIAEHAYCSDVFNILLPALYENFLKDRECFLDAPVQSYINMVAPLVAHKTFQEFIQDESSKEQVAKDWNRRGMGIRCYTFHSSKGLESDIVYILDADASIIPNYKHLKEAEKQGCAMEAAREVHNERNLVYVASTRAKSELHVCYNDNVSTLFTDNSGFENYDKMYEQGDSAFLDIDNFRNFIEG